MTTHPQWLVPIDDGSAPVKIEIRSERVVPPCVHVEFGAPSRLLTSLEAVQLGMALQDASRVAAELRVKMERRRR